MEADLQREGRINVTPKRIQSRPFKLKNEERNSLSQVLNNERIAGNVVTNFLDDINTSNEESIDEGHAPSWVVEKSARNIADKALTTGNKNWLDMIGKVDTYGGGNYAQTQKGRKIIRDTIALIDTAANARESKEYQKRTRVRADLKEEFTIGFNQVLGMPEGEDKEKLIKAAKADAFNKGFSNVYQTVYNNYDLINKREGLPVTLDDKKMIPKALEWVNESGNFATPEVMSARFTTYLAERNIQIGENQQSKIDKLLKAYTPLEGINEYKELETSIDKFGEDYIKELGVDAKWEPAEVRPVIATQKIALIKEFRRIFNQHRVDIKDDPNNKQQQIIPYGAWSVDQKQNLYDALNKAKEDFFTETRTAIKQTWDANKPDAKDVGTNDAWNKKYETLGNYVNRQRLGGEYSLSKKEEGILENLKAEMEAKWPQKWGEYEDAIRKGEQTQREPISFAKGADTDHTTAIREILADNAFEDPLYIQSQVTKYLNAEELELDEKAKGEIDEFKKGIVSLDEIPTTKESLGMFDKLITNIFPGYQAGLLSLSSMNMVKKTPNIPMEALFIIRDNVRLIKDSIKSKLKLKVAEYKVPYGLWSNEQKDAFKSETDTEVERGFIGKDSELIRGLKMLSPDSTAIELTPEQEAEQIEERIQQAFPNYQDQDIGGVGKALVSLVDGTSDKGTMRELYQKLLPINRIPSDIESMRKDILTVIAQYYRLIGQ